MFAPAVRVSRCTRTCFGSERVGCLRKTSLRLNPPALYGNRPYPRQHTCLNPQCTCARSEKRGKTWSKSQCCSRGILHLNPAARVWLPVCLRMPQAPKKRNQSLGTIFDFDLYRPSLQQDPERVQPALRAHRPN